MNEPFPGNLFADVTLALPGEAGRKNLQRMNDKVAAAITQHDDKHVIFYEPVNKEKEKEEKAQRSNPNHL